MSIYYCDWCGTLHDADWDVCVEDPRDSLALVCEEAHAEIIEALEEDEELMRCETKGEGL